MQTRARCRMIQHLIFPRSWSRCRHVIHGVRFPQLGKTHFLTSLSPHHGGGGTGDSTSNFVEAVATAGDSTAKFVGAVATAGILPTSMHGPSLPLSSLCMTMTSAPNSIHCFNNPLIFALSAGLSISSPRAEAIGIPTPPRFNRRLVGFAKKPSMALSHGREAGLPRHLSDVACWHA